MPRPCRPEALNVCHVLPYLVVVDCARRLPYPPAPGAYVRGRVVEQPVLLLVLVVENAAAVV